MKFLIWISALEVKQYLWEGLSQHILLWWFINCYLLHQRWEAKTIIFCYHFLSLLLAGIRRVSSIIDQRLGFRINILFWGFIQGCCCWESLDNKESWVCWDNYFIIGWYIWCLFMMISSSVNPWSQSTE